MTMPKTYTVSSNSAIDLPPSLNTTYDLNIVIPVENLDLTVYFYDDKGILQSEIPIFEPSQIEIINGNYSKIQFQDTKYSYEIFVTVKPNKYETFEEYEKAVSESEVYVTPIPFSQAPVFATASIIEGSVTTILPNQGYYVPITVTNSQSTATGTNFQLLVQVNTANYPQINPNCQNIFFYDSSGNILFSWIENVNSATTSTGTVNIWVNLGNNNINPNASITIYMGIGNSTSVNYLGTKNSSNQILVGANPQYTSTYGQYDNGQYVFNRYWNFAGTSLPSNLQETVLSNPSGASGSYSVNNGLTISNTNGVDLWDNDYMITLVYFTSTVSLPQIFQTKITSLSGNSGDSGWTKAGIIYQNSITASSTSNGEVDMVVTSGNGYAFQWQSGTSYVAPSGDSHGSSISYPSILTLIAQSTSSVGGFYGSSLGSLTQQGSYVTPTSIASSGYIGLFVTSHNSSGTSSATFQYLLARAYPPNGVMPSVSFGSITQVQNNPTIAYITPQNTGIIYFNFAIQNTSSSAIQFQVYNATNGYYVINESIPSGAIFPVKAYDNNLVLQQQYEYEITYNPSLAFYTFIIKESL